MCEVCESARMRTNLRVDIWTKDLRLPMRAKCKAVVVPYKSMKTIKRVNVAANNMKASTHQDIGWPQLCVGHQPVYTRAVMNYCVYAFS